MFKRFTVFVLVLMLALSVVGCGAKPEAPAQAPAPAPAPQVDKGAIVKDAVVEYFAGIAKSNNILPADKLKETMDAMAGSVYVLDIRAAEDFAKGHIPGATNIGFAKVGENLDKLPKGKKIAVVCYSGQTAGQTVSALRIAGFDAISLKGGFPAWETAAFPVEK